MLQSQVGLLLIALGQVGPALHAYAARHGQEALPSVSILLWLLLIAALAVLLWLGFRLLVAYLTRD